MAHEIFKLKCGYCNFKFDIQQKYGSPMDIAYCPVCNEPDLEYRDQTIRPIYRYRSKNRFFQEAPGHIWQIKTKDHGNFDIQGGFTNEEAREYIDRILVIKGIGPAQVLEATCIGRSIENKEGRR